MVAVTALMVMAAGAIRFTGTNREAAVAKARADRLKACVEMAKRRFTLERCNSMLADCSNATGAKQFVVPDNPNPALQSTMVTGHYHSAAQSPTVSTATTSDPMYQGGESIPEVTNRITGLSGGYTLGDTGLSYRKYIVKCVSGPPEDWDLSQPYPDNEKAEQEIEFLFR